MRSCSREHRASLAVLVVAALLCAPAAAQIVRFDGIDPGAQPGAPRPNSNAAAAEFDAAASELGSIHLIDAEALPLGNFASLEVAPGVTATLTGTTSASGIVQDLLGFWGNELYGFNTTAGGRQFFGFEPTYNIETASLELTFDEGVQAFGAYITGLGTSYGNLYVVFHDGSAQALPVTGNASGGVLFFGFTDAGKVIESVKLELRYAITGADVFGVDDIRFVDAAQTPCGLPGVTAIVSPSTAAPGQLVQVTLTNSSDRLIQLTSSCNFGGVYPGATCTGVPVFTPICLAVIVGIPPGTSYTSVWRQTDNGGVQVPNGTYSFSVRYVDATFANAFTCCVPVTIMPCGTPASATPRNGTGVNPVTLTNVGPPTLGGIWSADLDCSAHAPGLAGVVIFDAPATGPIIGAGEILVSGSLLLRRYQPHAGGTVTFSEPIPNDLGFCGLVAHAQGLCLGRPPGPGLTNALDLQIGM